MPNSSSTARTNLPSSSTPSPSPSIAPTAGGGGGGTITLKQRRGSLLRGDITTSPSTTIRNGKSRGGGGGGALSDDLVRNLGLDYDEVQKRTLTRWVNAKLSMAEDADHVDHIEKDLKVLYTLMDGLWHNS